MWLKMDSNYTLFQVTYLFPAPLHRLNIQNMQVCHSMVSETLETGGGGQHYRMVLYSILILIHFFLKIQFGTAAGHIKKT